MGDVVKRSKIIDVAETAKLVRRHLKAEFPGVKFSVRSSRYAGGASIDVRWTDGPTAARVTPVVKLYQGSTFDGMEDMKRYHDSLIVLESGALPEVVHFGADHVFAHREVSDEALARIEREILFGRCDHVAPIGGAWCRDCSKPAEWTVVRDGVGSAILSACDAHIARMVAQEVEL